MMGNPASLLTSLRTTCPPMTRVSPPRTTAWVVIWFSRVRGSESTTEESLASTDPSWILISSLMRRLRPLAPRLPLSSSGDCSTSGVTLKSVSAVTSVNEASRLPETRTKKLSLAEKLASRLFWVTTDGTVNTWDSPSVSSARTKASSFAPSVACRIRLAPVGTLPPGAKLGEFSDASVQLRASPNSLKRDALMSMI